MTRREAHHRHLDETREFYRAPFSGQVLRAAGPVLVMFWAEWGGPNRMVLPLVDEAAADCVGRLAVARPGPCDARSARRDRAAHTDPVQRALRPAARSEPSARASWSSGSTPASDTPPRQDPAAPGAARRRRPSAQSSEPGPGRPDKPQTCWRGLA
ncbi:thioredoxin family protein [Streptomyces rubiginosohelvolus]